MHIVFLTSEYPLPEKNHGGVGTFVKTIATELLKHDFKISVVGLHNFKDQLFFIDGIEINYIQKSKIKWVRGILNFQKLNAKLIQIHKKNPISIIEGAEFSFAFIKKIPNVKYLIRLHGGHHFFAESENRGINWWKAFQEKQSFKKADKIVGVSEYVVNHTSKYINFESKKVRVIYNPANFQNFYEANYNKVIQGRIFFAGTICEKKGIRQLIQALPIVKKVIPNAHLIIAGRDWYFPKTKKSYTLYLKKFISEEIKNSIEFLGVIPNDKIPEEIEKSEICCYPSHMEAMPLAWIEAMSMGKPIVASSLGPGNEIIKNYKNGIACNPLDIEELAKSIIYMLQNKKIARQMGVNARKFALENFNLSVIINQNIEMYQKLLKN